MVVDGRSGAGGRARIIQPSSKLSFGRGLAEPLQLIFQFGGQRPLGSIAECGWSLGVQML